MELEGGWKFANFLRPEICKTRETSIHRDLEHQERRLMTKGNKKLEEFSFLAVEKQDVSPDHPESKKSFMCNRKKHLSRMETG